MSMAVHEAYATNFITSHDSTIPSSSLLMRPHEQYDCYLLLASQVDGKVTVFLTPSPFLRLGLPTAKKLQGLKPLSKTLNVT